MLHSLLFCLIMNFISFIEMDEHAMLSDVLPTIKKEIEDFEAQYNTSEYPSIDSTALPSDIIDSGQSLDSYNLSNIKSELPDQQVLIKDQEDEDYFTLLYPEAIQYEGVYDGLMHKTLKVAVNRIDEDVRYKDLFNGKATTILLKNQDDVQQRGSNESYKENIINMPSTSRLKPTVREQTNKGKSSKRKKLNIKSASASNDSTSSDFTQINPAVNIDQFTLKKQLADIISLHTKKMTEASENETSNTDDILKAISGNKFQADSKELVSLSHFGLDHNGVKRFTPIKNTVGKCGYTTNIAREIVRARIIDLRKKGKSLRGISSEIGVSKTTVVKWVQRWETSRTVKDMARPEGMNKKTSDEDDNRIIEYALKHPNTNAEIIKHALNLTISSDTVRRRLNSAGIHLVLPRVQDRLTVTHVRDRFQFANDYANYDLSFWSRVIFTDDKVFSISNHEGMHSWHREHNRYEKENIYIDSQFRKCCINMWGWITMQGVGELCEISGRFNTDKYLEILEEVVLPEIRTYCLPYPEKIVFMQENCPIRCTRTILSWFEENSNKIELMHCPAKLYDVNPMENMWGDIVNSWKDDTEKSKEALREHTFNTWEKQRDSKVMYDYVASVPLSLQKIVMTKGHWISSLYSIGN